MSQRSNNGQDPRIDKHEQMLERLIDSTVRSEETIKMLADQTKENSDDIKQIKRETLINTIKTNIGQWTAMLIIAAIVGYFFSQLFK